MKRLCAVLLSLLAVLASAAGAKHHLIAAANPYAAKAGLEMLRRGGSAVDAAIAAQMVLTLVEPESSGLGGGAFMLVWDPAANKITSFDGRESAPASARPDMFIDAQSRPRAHADAIPGGLSVGVPGVVAMLELAHNKYGRLPWAVLFRPAIALAENGVPVAPKLARTLRRYPDVAAMPDIKRLFGKPDGTLYGQGERFRNPQLAASLRRIAKGGARAFYAGSIARAIVDKVRHAPRNPGGMTLADLRNYRARERPAVCAPYRLYRICSMGPPSSGGIAVLQILQMLQRFPPSDLMPGSLKAVHLFAQASRLAFADRAAYVGDPAFVQVPVAALLDRRYLKARSLLIDPARDRGPAEAGRLNLERAPQAEHERHGTSHMSVVDDSGVVVSMTTTVEAVFGAEMTAGGFVLNNELTDFSFEPERDGQPVANAPAAGKRPMSSMAPVIVFDRAGRFFAALGSPGGAAIISYVGETLIAMLDGVFDAPHAALLPHIVMMNGPLLLEKDTPLGALVPQLTAMGYDVRPAETEMSGLQIVQRLKNGFLGAADPRRDGVVLGD